MRLLGNLPSRAADNLFWFGRYLEREEATLRLVRCICTRAVDPDTPANSARQSLEKLKALLVAWGAAPYAMAKAPSALASDAALRDENGNGSALSIARAARHAASVIRERLTPETWRLIGRLESVIAEAPDRALSEPEIIDCTEEALTTIAALSGLFDENFNRGAGWIFYDMGRRIERGINTCRLTRQFAGKQASAHNLDVLLDLIDFADHLSLALSHRRRAGAGARHGAARSVQSAHRVAFQVASIDDHIAALPILRQDGMLEEPQAPVDAIARRSCDAGRRQDRGPGRSRRSSRG